MKLALLLLLPAAASFAEPCKDGPPLVGFDHRTVDAGPTSRLTVATTGAWAIEGTDASGKAQVARRGCLDKQALDQVTALVDGSPWKVAPKRVACRAMAKTWIIDSIKGKEIYQERICATQLLDEQSGKALVALHALLDKL